jgi:hypothetical protein
MKGPQAICSLNAPSTSRSGFSWRRCGRACLAHIGFAVVPLAEGEELQQLTGQVFIGVAAVIGRMDGPPAAGRPPMAELISSSPQPKHQRRHLTPHNKAGGEHHQVGLVADGREIGNGAGHRSQPAGTGACKATWGRFRHRPQASGPLTRTCGYGFHRKQPQPGRSLDLDR